MHTMKMDTIVTMKGTIIIPEPFRKALGITAGTTITWEVRDGKLIGEKRADAKNSLQAHIRKYSGVWKGASKVLTRTRGRKV
jgi:bifunctional DNA-binding transcriptional regulator/antitoxin component of YhaV-PrlF toxin-antitoxin module